MDDNAASVDAPDYSEAIREGRRRRYHLFALVLLGWIPLFAMFWLLAMIFGEQIANYLAVPIGLICMAVVTLRYTSWRCPRCNKFYHSAARVGYSWDASTPSNFSAANAATAA